MWPAFAKAAGIGADSVAFVNIGPTAKIAALKSHTVDIISDFYNEHDLKLKEFGDDLGYINWKDIGLNPYGNSLVVNGQFLQKNPKLAEDFVKIGQRGRSRPASPMWTPASRRCSTRPRASTSKPQLNQWERIKEVPDDGPVHAERRHWAGSMPTG